MTITWTTNVGAGSDFYDLTKVLGSAKVLGSGLRIDLSVSEHRVQIFIFASGTSMGLT
jgi:hypothetical protein